MFAKFAPLHLGLLVLSSPGNLYFSMALFLGILTGATMSVGMPISSHNSTAANFSEKKVANSTGFRLSLLAKKNQLKVHEPVLVDFLFQNVTKKTLTLVETFPERDYEIEVKNLRGEAVKLTARRETLRNNKGADFRVVGLKVKPGEQRTDTIDVAGLYDLSAPGGYSVKAIRKVPKLNSQLWGDVESNTLTITVIP
jgi:hypothetical protein